ncbi:tyrosine-type recombinase/integrase [Priestia megaterium]|uniref:tyrosine-type recombinase/integrase n=1 Tax=Priestia megaterium TaxID=1404 RepID=UPI002FE248B1
MRKKRKLRRNKLGNSLVTIEDAKQVVIKIKALEGMSKITIQLYDLVFSDLKLYFGGNKMLQEIDVNEAREFLSWQLNEKILHKNSNIRQISTKGLKPSSANTYLIKLRSAFSLLIKEGFLTKNVFQEIKNIKFPQKKVKTLTGEEIKQILNSFNKDYYSQFRSYVALHTLLDSMGRVNEILHLREEDIDFERRSITFQNTKSNKFRIVPISRKTVKLLQELIVENNETFESEYIFLTNHGKRLCADTFRTHVNRILKENNIERQFHPHLLRHTASEMFLRQSGNIRVLQQILGHADLTITSRTYAHVLDSTIRDQHDKYSPINLIDESTKKVVKRHRNREK